MLLSSPSLKFLRVCLFSIVAVCPSALCVSTAAAQNGAPVLTGGPGCPNNPSTGSTTPNGTGTNYNPDPGGPDGAPNQTIFGPNVYVITASYADEFVQNTLSELSQERQFSTNRYAVLFMPGTHGNCLDPIVAREGYYEQIAGLGKTPQQVQLVGGIYANQMTTDPSSGSSVLTNNFWRSQENMQIVPASGPTNGVLDWGVSQGTSFRRMDVVGDLWYANSKYDGSQAPCAEASGGFTADTHVSGTSNYCSQQQWYTRNSSLDNGFSSYVWNFVFSGVIGNLPPASFPGGSSGDMNTTELQSTPRTREKPYLYVDGSGNYNVFSPGLQSSSAGPTWGTQQIGPQTSLPISDFYIATPASDVNDINNALGAGKSLILTPGIYQYSLPIHVVYANTIVLGLGYATLVPQAGNQALIVDDVDNVQVAGLLIDAGPVNSSVLVEIGQPGVVNQRHRTNPTSLNDVFFRIGGATKGSATVSLQVDSADVILDNIWAWRADHGNAGTFGWTTNTAATGVLVNGANVEALGLAVEHYQEYQTAWNGENGTTIFYQSELPYDVPSQSAWTNNGNSLGVSGQNAVGGGGNGYPSYYVGPGVCQHSATGLGIYSFFNQGVNIVEDNAISVPIDSATIANSLTTVYLNGSGQITHIIDGQDGTANSGDASQPQQDPGGQGPGNCTAFSEPPGSTVLPSTTALSNPNPNNFDAVNIMSEVLHPQNDLILVASHRGLHALVNGNDPGVPENSLQAIGVSAQAGDEEIELDVKLTSDGIPILSHDQSWGRETCTYLNGGGPGDGVPFDPFQAQGSNSTNDARNLLVAQASLARTRYSFFDNFVLRDSISMTKGNNGFYTHGCSNTGHSIFEGAFAPTLADALDYMTANKIAMVLALDIRDAASASAAWRVIDAHSDYLGRNYLNTTLFKVPAKAFASPRDVENAFPLESSGSLLAYFQPVYNTSDIEPTSATTDGTLTNFGGTDVDPSTTGYGSEGAIIQSLADFENDPNINVAAVEIQIKKRGGILDSVLTAAKTNSRTGQRESVTVFSPYVDYYDPGDTNQTQPLFYKTISYCCQQLSDFYYNGTPYNQPSDDDDLRPNLSFLINYGFNSITYDDPADYISRLAALGYRNGIGRISTSSAGCPDISQEAPSIQSGQAISVNQRVASCDGDHYLLLQPDGNLVLYTSSNSPLWASGTQGESSSQAVMQNDGNFVIYDSSGAALWASGTSGNSGAYLAVQDDGNVVIYTSSGPVWATNTSGK